MKVQIRRSLFETNSSSVHTLSICTKPVNIEKYAGTTLRFGIAWNKIDKGDIIQEKLDTIFNYMVN